MKTKTKKEISIIFINIFILFAVFFNGFSFLNFSANDDLGQEIDPDSDQHNESQDITNEFAEEFKEICPCGREIYHENGPNYSKYDCVKCKKNMYLCSCSCWCGAPSHWSTSSESGQLTMYCRKCNLSCPDCTCADKTIALLKEQQMSEGKLSILNIPKPKNILSVVVLLFFITVISIFGVLFSSISNKPIQVLEGENKFVKNIKKILSNTVLSKSIKNTSTAEPSLKIKTDQLFTPAFIWPIDGKLPAISAYELCNNILFESETKTKTESYLMKFIKDYYKDSEKAMANSLTGKYGEVKKIFAVASKLDLKNQAIKQKLSAAVGEDFWDIIEESAAKILKNYDIDNVTDIVFSNEIKTGIATDNITDIIKNTDIGSEEIGEEDFALESPLTNETEGEGL